MSSLDSEGLIPSLRTRSRLAIRRVKIRSPSPPGGAIDAKATNDPSAIRPVDLVLFCVKIYDTDAAAAQVRPLVGGKPDCWFSSPKIAGTWGLMTPRLTKRLGSTK